MDTALPKLNKRPTPGLGLGGRGSMAWEAFICASRDAARSEKAMVFLASMSTWSDMFSEVAETQPSVA